MIVDPDGLIMHNEQLQTKALVPLDLQNDSIAGVEVIPKAFRSVSPKRTRDSHCADRFKLGGTSGEVWAPERCPQIKIIYTYTPQKQ